MRQRRSERGERYAEISGAVLARLNRESLRDVVPPKSAKVRWVKVPRVLTLERDARRTCSGCISCLAGPDGVPGEQHRLTPEQLGELIRGRGIPYKLLLNAYRWGRVYGHRSTTQLPDFLEILERQAELPPALARQVSRLPALIDDYLGRAIGRFSVGEFVSDSLAAGSSPSISPQLAYLDDRSGLDEAARNALRRLRELDLLTVIDDPGRRGSISRTASATSQSCRRPSGRENGSRH